MRTFSISVLELNISPGGREYGNVGSELDNVHGALQIALCLLYNFSVK